jgi:phenylacetate-CoA ligase
MATTTHTNPVIYDAVETVSRDELATLQLGRLREVVRRRGVDARVDAPDDLRDLPFTTKEDLRAHYPLGMMVVSHDRLVRLHSSSGTSGKPTIVGHTFGDLDVWADIMARCLAAAGVGRGTVLHNAYGYGLTTGGCGFQQGAELLGATVVPAAGASTDLQLQLLGDLRTQVLCCTPSFAVQIAEAARADGIELALEVGILGGEMWTPAMRHRLEADLGPRSTATASARSSARASPRSAWSATTAPTSTRTTSSARSSTPRRAVRSPPASWASSSSRR